MKAAEARALIGKRVEWLESFDRHRGTGLHRSGIIEEVRGRNIRIGEGDWKWLPDMRFLKEAAPEKEKAPEVFP